VPVEPHEPAASAARSRQRPPRYSAPKTRSIFPTLSNELGVDDLNSFTLGVIRSRVSSRVAVLPVFYLVRACHSVAHDSPYRSIDEIRAQIAREAADIRRNYATVEQSTIHPPLIAALQIPSRSVHYSTSYGIPQLDQCQKREKPKKWAWHRRLNVENQH
jgi:hypothetical protein